MQSVNRVYLVAAVSAVALLSAESKALAAEAAPSREAADIETVVVTARRREESLQETPISAQVITPQQLQKAGAKNLYDLVALTPGVNISGGASKSNPFVSIRGLSRGFQGAIQPAVGVYFNDVPNIMQSAAMPLYDISGVQILKGPQGTLFGRNTTAGAVLVTSKAPTYEMGGSAQVTLGSYDWHTFDGVLNVPIVEDKVALRLTGQRQRRKGYTKIGNAPGERLDAQHVDSYRVSLLLEPVEKLRNLTVFDFTRNAKPVAGAILHSYTPGELADVIPFYNGTLFSTSPAAACNGSPVCDIKVAIAQQRAVGPRTSYVTPPPGGFLPSARQSSNTLVNTTSYDLGFATLKNIFGYRTHKLHARAGNGGTQLLYVNTHTIWNFEQYSDELNLSGEALNGNLNWIVGGFWHKSQPGGKNFAAVQAVQPSNVPFVQGANASSVYYYDSSKAAYGQINYKFGGVSEALSGLSTDLGIRYTEDKSSLCSVVGLRDTSPIPSADECPASRTPKVNFSKVTYTIGLNYQATDDVLAYVVHRRGYRAGFSNAPVLGGTLRPFQAVRPQTVTDYEAGLKTNWRLGDMPGRFNIAAFKSKYKDVQGATTVIGLVNVDGDNDPTNDPTGLPLYINVGNAETSGVEIDAAISPIEGLELGAAASWLHKEITKVTFPPLPAAIVAANRVTPDSLAAIVFYSAPRYSYTASASYTLPLASEYGELKVGLTYFKQSEIRYEAILLPSYSNLNASIDWNRVMGSNVDVGLFVTNLTNKAAAVGGANSSPGLGFTSVFYNEPRMVGVRLRYAMGSER